RRAGGAAGARRHRRPRGVHPRDARLPARDLRRPRQEGRGEARLAPPGRRGPPRDRRSHDVKRWTMALALALAACARGNASTKPGRAARAAPSAAEVEVVRVAFRKLDATAHLEGELSPYEAVAIHARANAFVATVPVDRGTRVKQGQLLASLVAP